MLTLTSEQQKELVIKAGFEQWPDEEFGCFAKCYTHSLSQDITISETEMVINTPQVLKDPNYTGHDGQSIWVGPNLRGVLIHVLMDIVEEIDYLNEIESEKIGCDRDVIARVCGAAIDTELSVSDEDVLEKAGYSLKEASHFGEDTVYGIMRPPDGYESGEEDNTDWVDESYPSLYQHEEGGVKIWGVLPDHKDSGIWFEDVRVALELVVAMMSHSLVLKERKYELYCGVSRMIQKSILPHGFKYNGKRAWNCGDQYRPGGCAGPVDD